MTTGLNNTDETPSSKGGFWGKPLNNYKEIETSAEEEPQADEHSVSLPNIDNAESKQRELTEPEHRPAVEPEQRSAARPNQYDNAEPESHADTKPEQHNIPEWLKRSHIGEEVPEPASDEADLGSTAALPFTSQLGGEVFEPAASEPKDVLSASETQTPLPASVEADATGVLYMEDLDAQAGASQKLESESEEESEEEPSWHDDLSWDDDVLDDTGDLSGYLLDVDEVGYVSPDTQAQQSAAVYMPNLFAEEAGNTATSTVYDEGDAVGTDRKTKLRVVAVVVPVVLALVVVYVLGVRRFGDHMLPNTHINGLNVAGMTVDEARDALEQETSDYTCTVSVDGFSTNVSGSDISIERDEESMAKAVKDAQSAYSWPLALVAWPQSTTEAGVTFDEESLEKVLTAAVEKYNQETLPTKNARIDYNEATGLFEVSGTTEGVAVDAQAVVKDATADIRNFGTTSKPATSEATHDATVHDIPSYEKTAENANKSRTNDIPILVDGEEVLTSTADQHVEWVKVGQGPSVSVDEDSIRAWAEYTVATAVFHTDDWSNYFLDVDAFVDEFSKRLANGETDGFEAPTYDELRTEGESREKAYEKGGWDSELGRYIDVDLESQFARLFDESGEVIWESAFVSGDMYQGHSTVTGIFEIYSMQTNTVLVGMDYNGDGEPDYESFVNYWMPFYGGYGLHDATWRSNFGGEYYYYNGSHGCVNLPYRKAAELYGMTHVGEKVNVHW